MLCQDWQYESFLFILCAVKVLNYSNLYKMDSSVSNTDIANSKDLLGEHVYESRK